MTGASVPRSSPRLTIAITVSCFQHAVAKIYVYIYTLSVQLGLTGWNIAWELLQLSCKSMDSNTAQLACSHKALLRSRLPPSLAIIQQLGSWLAESVLLLFETLALLLDHARRRESSLAVPLYVISVVLCAFFVRHDGEQWQDRLYRSWVDGSRCACGMVYSMQHRLRTAGVIFSLIA